jgi:Glycosyl transferase family 2
MAAVVLIPARDEAETVAETVRAARALEGATRVVVVDDGSTDETGDLARDAGAEVLVRHAPGGKAAALEDGLRRLLAGDPVPDAVLLLDADLGGSASEAAALLAPVLTGAADMAIAAFPPAPAGSGGFGLVKGLARAGIHALGSRGFEAAAPLSGQRALGHRALAVAMPLGRGYGVEVALTVRALRAGLTVAEVPTAMTHRHTGRDAAGFSHRGRQFVDVAMTLFGLAFERKRLA